MRILIDYRPALRQRTGVGEYAHELARALTTRLAAPDMLVLFSSSWKDRLSAGTIPNAPIVDARVPVTLLNLAWHRLEWPPVESFAADIDIAHSMHPLLMPARAAAQVVTVHDLYFLDSPGNTAAEIRRDYPALAASHARRADLVVTVSNYTSSQVQKRLAVDPDRIAICSPGRPSWTPVARHAANGPILFMGTVEPRKNVRALLRAYAELVERRPATPALILAGKIADSCRDIARMITEPPFAGRVRAVGYVSGADRERLFREASMLVLPSFDEGFGLPALEAMTLGIPVIAAARGALPEVVGAAGLLVEPEAPAELAAAMERVLAEPQFAQHLSAAGIAQSAKFTWEASATTLAQAYQAAIERRRARR